VAAGRSHGDAPAETRKDAVKDSVTREDPFEAGRALYRRTLLEDVVPFWMRHGIDRQYGGIGNVIDDQGQPLGHDKYLWSQGRALWTFSALFNRVEQRPEWLEVAHHIFRYLESHGRDDAGRWMYRLAPDGQVLEKDISIYVDGFVMTGLGEYYRATRNPLAARLATETYANVLQRLGTPGSYGVAPYVIPEGLKTHGIAMIFSYFFFNLGQALDRPDMRAEGVRLAREILDHFYVPAKDAVLEFVTLEGRFSDTPAGRACVPGHAIEAMWFLIEIFEQSGDRDRIATCSRLIRRHLEMAWDPEFGGLRLALDIDGRQPGFWKNPEVKAWWVHGEALVATAYAALHTGEPWCREWHARVRDFAFAHYPVPTGEWTQWLDRRGAKAPSAALPVKDPFHLPRALMTLMNLCEKRIPNQEHSP
jgi:N-acylglucosamine 2-epimerase